MPKLTKRFVETAPIKDKPYFVFDKLIPGFCTRISPNGKRYYYFQYMKNKVRKRLLLGQHGVITSEKAREYAINMLGDIQDGEDPHKIKAEKKLEPLMTVAAKRFMSEHAAIHCKISTQKGYHRYLDIHILPFFGHMKISEVTRASVALFHNSLQKTPYEANRCLEIVSKIFNLTETWGLRSDCTNPCRGIKKFPMKPRNRYLSKEEVTRLGGALDEAKQYPDENLAAVYCIQLLMLTGCRLGEIQTLKLEYVDFEKGLLRLPDSKTGAKIVYVGDPVMALLEEIKNHPRRPKSNIYLIWSEKKEGAYLNNIHKFWKRICKIAKLHDFRIHDLRHNFASIAVNLGMSFPMIGKLLGHTQAQTTSRYAHLIAGPMKEAANSVTSELSQVLKVSSNLRNDKNDMSQSDFKVITGTAIKAPTYFTSVQAAEYLNVKNSLMEYWRWRKNGPAFIKVGGRIRYKLEALEEFLSNTSSSLSESGIVSRQDLTCKPKATQTESNGYHTPVC